MTYIRKEVPSGTIDGVNKVFTVLNDVDFIDDLWYDGAITTDFTRVGKVLTLSFAPQISIFVDYKTGTTAVPIQTDCTLGDMKTKVWSLLGTKSTSGNFNDEIVTNELNMIGRAVWKGKLINKLNPQKIIRAGDMHFKNGLTNVRIKSGGILTAPFNLGDTELSTDTSNLLSAGYVEIGGDIIKYTGKSTTQLLGVSGATIDHLISEKVIQIYEMPVDIDKPSKVEYAIKDTQARTREIPLDNTNSYGYYYEILRSGTTMLLKIVGLFSDDLIKVNYVKKYVNLNANTDLCPFPEDYGISVIAYLVAGSLGYDKGVPNSQQHLNSGYTSLQVMYGDFNNETYVVKQKIMPRAFSR